jgi:CheY-like chemotaxis protein
MENHNLHILLADDDEADRLLFKDAFKEMKIKTVVDTVNDGVELMVSLTQQDIRLPDFLFLDLNMPRKNGLECLAEIRSNKAFNDMFIAIYSTSSSEKDVENTFLGGANVYIQKPSDYQELKAALEKAVVAAHQYKDPPFNKENFLLRV